MKHIITAIAMTMVCAPALAASNATSQTESIATSAAQNAGNTQAIQFNSAGGDDQTVRSAPGIGGQGYFGSFSGDSCMVSGGGGVSIVGFGAQYATPVEDKHCNLRRNFERVMQASNLIKTPGVSARLQAAAIDILCQAGSETQKALAGQGFCSDAVRSDPQVAASHTDPNSLYIGG